MGAPEADPRIDLLWDRDEPEDGALTARLRAIASRLLEATGAAERELSLVLTDAARMTEHNRVWRGVDGPTDVLSFPMDEGELVGAAAGVGPLGDVVICLDTAAEQAARHGWPLDHEVTFLLIHGLCHLQGHDHGDPDEAARMRAEEDRLLAVVAPGQGRPPTPY